MISRYKYSLGFINDTQYYANHLKKNEKKEYEKLNLKEIHFVDFPEDQYYRAQTDKNQIVLHHTVSPKGVRGDLNWWLQTTHRIATHVIVDWKGEIYQCYSSKYWGHHLGVKDKKYNNVQLNKQSIGIEIDSWGGLVEYKNKWYPAKWENNKFVANTNVAPIENVQEYPNGFRGFYGFEKYTQEQILSIRKLLVYWCENYNISFKYNDDMWDVNNRALSGENGIWTHVSYREDKSDCHPQPELIDMLKTL